MDTDFLFAFFSALFQAFAWIGLAGIAFAHERRMLAGCQACFGAGMLGLGVMLLYAAAFQTPCWLAAGLAAGTVLLFAIQQPCRDWRHDPYAHIYPPESPLIVGG